MLLDNAGRLRPGLAPRARRDIDAAVHAGRFSLRDPELSLAIIAGATPCLGQLLHDHRYPIWATFHNAAPPRQLPVRPDLPDRSHAQRSMARSRRGNLLESVVFGSSTPSAKSTTSGLCLLLYCRPPR